MSDGIERHWLTHDTPHVDLRDFIDRADKAGELVHAKGVHWDLEMGALAEAVSHKRTEARAVLIDQIPDYPEGFRVLCGGTNSPKRIALALGFAQALSPMDMVRAYRDRMKVHKPIAPRVVTAGPVLENVQRDAEVDLFKFPAPWLHEHDGGRYIGTNDLVIMRDPEQDWVNAATYRVMLHSKNHAGLWMSPGKQGRQIMEKYFKMGKACPVLVSCGHDPLLFLAGGQEVRYGVSELDYAGGHRGQPIEVLLSELHRLPMPAHAEIVLEGEIQPGDVQQEGPFGEWTGYYASAASKQPVIRVKRVYHRDDPIMTVSTPMRPPSDGSLSKCIVKAGMIWDYIESAGLAGVQGVWAHEAGIGRLFNVVSIKQAYAGHSKQAGMLAASCQAGAYMGRFTVVVDEDVGPADLFDVIWAMCTRCDPVLDIDFIRNMWSSPLDPVTLGAKAFYTNRAVIDACRPYERLKDFPKVARASAEMLARVHERFADILAKV